MLTKVHNLLCRLKETNGTKAKQALLVANKDMPGLKDVFDLALNPEYTYHRTVLDQWDKPKSAICLQHSALRDSTVFDMMRTAAQAGKPSDNACIMYNLTNACSITQMKICNMILARKPDCGVGKGMINEVWPGLLRTQVYQGAIADNKDKLCKLYNREVKADQYHGVIVDLKYDGLHWIIEGDDPGRCTNRSRQGELLPSPAYFDWHMQTLFDRLVDVYPDIKESGLYLAAEALIMDSNSPTLYKSRAVGNGLINNGELSGLHLRVFDVLTKESAHGINPAPALVIRKDVLRKALRAYRIACAVAGKCQLFYAAVGWYTNDYNKAVAWVEDKISKGHEGAIHKDPNHTFKNGKPAACIKQTFAMPVDALVTDTTEHKTKAGQIGALVCYVPGGPCNSSIKFKVGSGLTDVMRTSHSDDLIGRCVTVTIKDLSKAKSKNAVTSVTNPRIEDIRTMGHEVDCADDVFQRYEERAGRKHELDER